MKQKKQRSNAAVNSRLIRRPIQRCFAIFLLPTFVAFCIGFLYPFIHGIYLSFCKFTTTSNAKWVGLDNYARALKDASFMHAFGYTALVAVTSLIIINILAFAVAYALTRGIRGSNLFRGVFFLPNLIGGIVLGWIWQMIFNGFLTLTNGFKLFDQNLVLTGGQPFTFQPDGTIIRSTEMLALNIYNTFYLNSNSRGMGQAKAVLFFILVAAIALIQLRATHSREVQQ